MFIEQLDKTRLLITLENEDLSIFDLSPDSLSMEDKETRDLFKQLLALAAVKTGVVLRNKTISVELMPYDRGCFILATIKGKGTRKIYRIKKTTSYLPVRFENIGDMLDAVKNLYVKGFTEYNCSLYGDRNFYYLLMSSKAAIPKSARIMLSEYGSILPGDNLTVSRIREVCKLICEDNSIVSLGKQL